MRILRPAPEARRRYERNLSSHNSLFLSLSLSFPPQGGTRRGGPAYLQSLKRRRGDFFLRPYPKSRSVGPRPSDRATDKERRRRQYNGEYRRERGVQPLSVGGGRRAVAQPRKDGASGNPGQRVAAGHGEARREATRAIASTGSPGDPLRGRLRDVPGRQPRERLAGGERDSARTGAAAQRPTGGRDAVWRPCSRPKPGWTFGIGSKSPTMRARAAVAGSASLLPHPDHPLERASFPLVALNFLTVIDHADRDAKRLR